MTTLNNIKTLKPNEIYKLKQDILSKNSICPILKVPLTMDEAVIDHQHKKNNSEILGENGCGLVRGAIDRFANMLLGKVENSFIRTGLDKKGYNLSEVLRNMADYLDDNISHYEKYVHPSEAPKPKKITKTSYNNLLKVLKENNYTKKVPEYPKSGTLTKPLEVLFNEYEVKVEYYK